MARHDVRSGGTARIRAVAASGLCDTIRQLGADPEALLRRAQLSSEVLEQPDAWLLLSEYCGLLEEVAGTCDLRLFGLKFGLSRFDALLGDLGLLAASAPTLYAAFQALSRYMPTLQEQSAIRFERCGACYAVQYQIRDGHIIRRRQDAELTLGALIGFIRSNLGPSWTPREVHFEHPCNGDPRSYDGFLGAPVYFSQCRNALLMEAEDAGSVLRAADVALHTCVERRVRQRMPDSHHDDFVGIVLQEMRDGMARGRPGIETVARRLDLSAPALYRRLKTCGFEFSSMQRDLRREIAMMHVIEPHIPLTEVALLLGYSELSAFSRAFRAWTGVSAIDYRRRCHVVHKSAPHRPRAMAS